MQRRTNESDSSDDELPDSRIYKRASKKIQPRKHVMTKSKRNTTSSTQTEHITALKYKWSLSIYEMVIIGKYFDQNNDYINAMKVSKRYRDLTQMYHFNPISDTSLFINMETQHFYIPEEGTKLKKGMNKYIYWCDVKYSPKLDFEKSKFKRVILSGVTSRCQFIKGNECDVPEGVTDIDDKCFMKASFITKITIPSTIKNITSKAFNGTLIRSVTIREGCEEIGEHWFDSCPMLEEIEIPSTVKVIRRYAMNRTCLACVLIPQSIERVERMAFPQNCKVKTC